MPRPASSARIVAAPVVLALAAWGCGPAAAPATKPSPPGAAAHDHGHDHADHDHPETLAEGIAQLAEAAAGVKKHLAAGATDAADEIVHGVGHIIEDVQGLLPKEKLSSEAEAAVKKALDELFECFDKLDSALHAPAGQGTSPAEVHAGLEDRIQAAIKALQDVR